MSPVLGVLLICYSSRGHQLVFSYPSDPKRTRGQVRRRTRPSRTLLQGASPERLESFDRSSLLAHRGPDGHLRQNDSEQFLGFETHFLSDVLSPKVALCDRQFQLTVDDVTFVGHPTLLHADRPGTGHRFARMIQRKRLAAQDAAADPTSSSSVNPDTSQLPAESPLSESGRSEASQKSAGMLASSGASASAHQLTMFNLVFAMQPNDGQREVDDMYIHIISKITAALKYEQLKRGYIRREAELILSIKDEAQCKTSERVHLNDIMDRILTGSTLAKCLADIYNSITNQSGAHVVVNASVDLSLHIPERGTKPLSLSSRPLSASGTLDQSVTNSRDHPILRPYHALLLLHDPEEVLKSLPLDTLPLLVELIQIVTPTQCFEQLQTMLDCSLSQLYRLAAHLVHWHKAKIIDVISMRNVYVVAPEAPLEQLPRLMEEFNNRFPQMDLPTILADLSTPRPYSVIIPRKEARTLYLEVLTFLLRHDLVAQLHMYIYLMIPYSICKNSTVGNVSDSEGPTAIIIPDPAKATELEREWINQVACEHPSAIASLFLRYSRLQHEAICVLRGVEIIIMPCET
ncbi:nitrogen permease regulator of amino acid transport activity 3-domain-containing protein [Powellomyces hirtus]|nr:nitrogen permease regulator of amino acid transport activity 3-domain-containing protein [Powellomyces hirtus]